MIAAAEEDAADWCNVGVIAAPSDRNMAVAGEAIVRGIKVNPTQILTTIKRNPRMGLIVADESLFARRRRCPQISADVASAQAKRSQTSYLDM